MLRFGNNLDENLLEIQRKLRNGTMEIGPYRKHWVYVPKKRLVMALPFEHRIVQWAIYLELNPFFDQLMIEDSYACRNGKGSLRAARRLQYWLREIQSKPGDWYVIKLDISKFFYRVDHSILLEILGDRIKDKRLMDLLNKIINCDGVKFGLPQYASPEDVPDEEWLGEVGMPIGNLTSQLFANIYLNELDQYCKHTLHIRKYDRYMDDVTIVIQEKQNAIQVVDKIRTFLSQRLCLDLNKKTTVRPAHIPVEYVGYIVTARELKLRKPTVRRIKSSWHEICRKYFAGEITKKQLNRRIESYKGMFAPCKNEGIIKRMNEIYLFEKKKATEEDKG